MSDNSWVVLDEYSFDGGKTVEYRHPRFYAFKGYAEKDADRRGREQMVNVGFVRCVIRPLSEVRVSLDDESELRRMKRLHEVTADHLRDARCDIRYLRCECERLRKKLEGFVGADPYIYGIDTYNPSHYMGDGFVTCSRAMDSAMSQKGAASVTRLASYWWCCAFKYLWRMWDKNDPESDASKAIDCIDKAFWTWKAGQDGR